MLTKKFLSAMAISLMLGSAAFAGPLDDGINECGVPVCNIDETIAALTELNGDQRYNYANKMLTKYSDSEDLKVLENLLDASKKMKALSVSTSDADWVVRESNSLTNAMVIGLAKHSEIDANKLSGFFKQITTGLKRYEIIEFWTKKVDTIENIKELNDLVIFAKNAKAHSTSVEDESWIPRAAHELASKITIKLTALDPAHEGVYNVESTINGVTDGILPFDKVAVLDSSAQENLVVIFYNSQYKRASFTFNDVTLSGNTLTSTAISNMITSKKFSMELDRTTGVVKGSVSTTDSDITFSGVQTFSTRTVFAGEVPHTLTENDAIGTFEGKIGSMDVTLTVKSFLPGVYHATLRSANGVIKKDYKGKFFPKNGVLSLTHDNNLKLVISLRKVGEEVKWQGFSYSIKRPTAIEAVFNN